MTKIESVELYRLRMPLKGAFRTSFGTQSVRDILLVRVLTPDAEGWGECVAGEDPGYSYEYVDGAQDVIRRFLLPPILGNADVTAWSVSSSWKGIRGHRMAKAGVETAVLDAELRARGESLAEHLGAMRERVDCGVSVGIPEGGIAQLLDQVDGYLEKGYVRIKLKIEPGWDVEPVRAVRERYPDVLLQVDANQAYEISDGHHLAKLDAFDLLLIEQPLGEERVRDHAELQRYMKTPICLDESIVSAQAAADAIAMSACRIVNIKPGRVGGYLEARRVHDVCEANGIPVWCGGMLESGIGRAANVALAALPNFALPGDTSASDRYFDQDITPPFVLEDGKLAVPAGPGIGVSPIPDVLVELTTSKEVISA